MLSVVIKNSILMLLLILIIHFIIINYISDLQQEYARRNKQYQEINKKPEVVVSTCIKPVQVAVTTTPEQIPDTPKHVQPECNQLKDLYDFVYGDEKAEGDLSKMFNNIKPCDFDDNKLEKCADQTKPDEIALCKNDIDNHHDEKAMGRLNVNIPHDEKEITKDGNPILFTYDESNKELLSGYEGFGSSYMLIKN